MLHCSRSHPRLWRSYVGGVDFPIRTFFYAHVLANLPRPVLRIDEPIRCAGNLNERCHIDFREDLRRHWEPHRSLVLVHDDLPVELFRDIDALLRRLIAGPALVDLLAAFVRGSGGNAEGRTAFATRDVIRRLSKAVLARRTIYGKSRNEALNKVADLRARGRRNDSASSCWHGRRISRAVVTG